MHIGGYINVVFVLVEGSMFESLVHIFMLICAWCANGLQYVISICGFMHVEYTQVNWYVVCMR